MESLLKEITTVEKDYKEESRLLKESDSIHRDLYLWLFIPIAICFGLSSYYFYNLVKKYLQRINANPEDESKVEQTKNEIFKNLSVFSFIRMLSCLVVFILSNKHSNNYESFFCYISQTFPELILFSILLYHASFIIEKYYQIKYRKTDIFFTPSLEVLNILVYIVFSLFMLACVLKGKFLTFMYLCQGISTLISAILSLLYLFYGISLANVYSTNKSNSSELKEKKFIYGKLWSMSLFLGLIFFAKCIVSFLVCLNIFGDLFPSYVNPHIWDCTKLIIFELTTIFILGNTKQRLDNPDEITKKSFMNFNERNEMIDNKQLELHQKEMEQIIEDLNEPLLP